MDKTIKKILAIATLLSLFALLFVGCAAARFKTPEMNTPQRYHFDSVATKGDSVVSLEWWESFGDAQLNELIGIALDSNRNLATVASKVEQSRLELRQARAALGPTLGLSLNGEGTYTDQTKIVQSYAIEPTLSWEIDIFGKLRYAAQAAKAQMLAQEQYYRSTKLALAAQVASAYFSLLEYDLSLRISKQTYEVRKTSAALMDSMFYYGEATRLDVEQNRSLVASAAVSIASYTQARDQAIMSLCTVLGVNPQMIEVDGEKLLHSMIPPTIPAGLPTSLLSRRPDILNAYYTVQASYADVGTAIANRFPSLTLTGEGGLLSSTLKGLFNGNPWGWSSVLNITQPIFAFGRNKRAVQIAEEEKKQSILSYEQTVLTALSEVESALIGIASYRSQIENQKALVESNKITQTLTQELYNNGENTYLNVLDAEREYFSAQLDYASTLGSQLSEYVTLYKALGGGY